MSNVEYIINNAEAWCREIQNSQNSSIDYEFFISIFESFIAYSEPLFQKHIDELECELKKLDFLTYEEFYDREICDLVNDHKIEFEESHIEEIEEFGLKAKIHEIEKWYKLNTNFFEFKDESTLPFDLMREILDKDIDELIINGFFEAKIKSLYKKYFEEILKLIIETLNNDKVNIEKIIFDFNVSAYGEIFDMNFEEIKNVFIYYYQDDIKYERLHCILEMQNCMIFPPDKSYRFIRDFNDVEELLLWLLLH